MAEFTTKYAVGSVFIIQTGHYDNTVIQGAFRCLKDIDLNELAREYLNSLRRDVPTRENGKWADIREHRALSHHVNSFHIYLITQGYVEEIVSTQINLGDFYFDDCWIRAEEDR